VRDGECGKDRAAYHSRIAENLIVPEANDAKALGSKEGIPPSVILIVRML
jgi:hypothetical protein